MGCLQQARSIIDIVLKAKKEPFYYAYLNAKAKAKASANKEHSKR